MKKKYEKPTLKVVEITLDKCIAASPVQVKQGQSVHQNLESETSGWEGDVIMLDENGDPKANPQRW